jgi:hypothetical protein
MSIGSILLGLALLALVGLFVSRPLLEARSSRGRRVTLRQSLLVQKEAILIQIRTLDFDFETGKIPEEDYQHQRAAYLAEAVEIVKQLDELESARETAATATADAVPTAPESGKRADIDAQIEAAIARQREEAKPESPAPVQEARPSAKPTAQNGRAGYCPQCGKAIDGSDKFCSHCGHQLQSPQLA